MSLETRVREAVQARKRNKRRISTKEIVADLHAARLVEHLLNIPDRSVLRAAAVRVWVRLTDPSERAVHRIVHELKPELHLESRGPTPLRRFTRRPRGDAIPSH